MTKGLTLQYYFAMLKLEQDHILFQHKQCITSEYLITNKVLKFYTLCSFSLQLQEAVNKINICTCT